MTYNINIPTEAVEGIAKRLAMYGNRPWQEYLNKGEDLLRAGLNAWPGIITKPATPDGQWTHNATIWAHIILPLHPEKETSE